MNFQIFILKQDDRPAKNSKNRNCVLQFCFLHIFFKHSNFFFLFSYTDCIDSANIPQDNLFLIMLMQLSSSTPQGHTSLHGEALSTLILFSSPILWSTSETSNSLTCRCVVQPRVRSVITTPDTSHPIKVGLLSFSLCACARGCFLFALVTFFEK